MTAYAESEDGITWHKPKLGIIEFDGSTPEEAGWLSQELITQGVPVENTSKTDPLVLTIDFQQEVHLN